MLRLKSIEDLCRIAEKALEDEDFKRALSIGRELNRRSFSYGFEVVARAHAGLDEVDKAILVLEEGVKRVPDVDILWHLLACHYSDTGRYEEAHGAFERMIALSPADDGLGLLNDAVVYYRQKSYAAALAVLDQIPAYVTNPHPCVVAEQRVRVLDGLNRHSDIIEVCNYILTRLDIEVETSATEIDLGVDRTVDAIRAGLFVARGAAILKSEGDRDRAIADAWTAIQIDKTDESAASLIREIDADSLTQGKRYHLLVQGRWHEPAENTVSPPGFFTNYEVLADDLDQALVLASRFEPSPVRGSLSISEAEVLESGVDGNAGVISASPYVFYDYDGPDDEEEN